MRLKIVIVCFLACLGSVYVRAQDLTATIKQIKIGNSLREAQQFDNSEVYLLRGLNNAKHLNNQYWQAVALEYLGILSRDMKDEAQAVQYLESALTLYKSIGMDLSARAVKDILGGFRDSNDDLYAGIEVGAKGVKYSIIRVRRVNGQISFTNIAKGSTDVGTVSLTDQAITETANAVTNYANLIQHSATPVPLERIFVAVSSGVKQELDKSAARREMLRAALMNALPGKDIGFLTPGLEVKLTIRGTVSSRDLFKSTSMDIGSGNTKGGYFKDRDNIDSVSIPWGSSTFAKKIGDKKDKLGFAQKFFNDSILNNPSSSLSQEIERKSGFLNRKWCFLSGGIVWAITSWLYPEKVKEPFIEFTPADVDKFISLVSTDEGFQKLAQYPDLSKISDDSIMMAAKAQWDGTHQFSNIQLIAGSVILKGVMEEMNKAYPKKKFYFIRSGEVGWISGYIAKQIADKYNATHAD